MPYIELKERDKFKVSIESVVSTLSDTNDTPYVKGEYFGYFVNRVARKFLGDQNYVDTAFNSHYFNQEKKKTLSNSADKVAACLTRGDPLHAAGDLHYAVSAVYFALLGQSKSIAPASLGMQMYLVGVIDKIYTSLESVTTGSPRDSTMAFRRHLVIRGVLRTLLGQVEPSSLLLKSPSTWSEDGNLNSLGEEGE